MAKGKVATRELNKIRNKQLVLDTSVIILLSDIRYRPQVGAALNQLEGQGNQFFVSELTLYELNKSSRTAADVAKKARLLSRFSPLPVDQNRLIHGGLLFSTMKNGQQAFQNKEHKISCDMIIGGTVVENPNSLLMTTNSDDFHLPCWRVVAEGRVVKKNKGNGWTLANWYLFEFDYSKMPEEFLTDELRQRFTSVQKTLLLPEIPAEGEVG